MTEALNLGLTSYYFVGFVLGVWWTTEAARSPANRVGPGLLVMAVLIFMLIWPAVLAWMFDSEDRWKR